MFDASVEQTTALQSIGYDILGGFIDFIALNAEWLVPIVIGLSVLGFVRGFFKRKAKM